MEQLLIATVVSVGCLLAVAFHRLPAIIAPIQNQNHWLPILTINIFPAPEARRMEPSDDAHVLSHDH